MLQSRALALRVSCYRPVLYRRSLAVTQRVFPALAQGRLNIPPSSAGNNQPTIITRQIHDRMSNSPYVISDSDEPGDDDDQMLARAIKLSMEQENLRRPQSNREPSSSLGGLSEVTQGKRKADCIVISDTDSDDQSCKWVARGSREASASVGGKRKKVEVIGSPKGSGDRISSMGLDRAQMERERLERLGRKGFSSSSVVGVQQNEKGIKPASFYPPAVITLGGGEKNKGKGKEVVGSQTGVSTRKPMDLPFPNGAVKKTWVYDVQRDGSEIKIEEVLGKETLYGAVLSSFQWEFEWVWSKIPNGKLQRFVLVIPAKTAFDKERVLEGLGGLPKTTVVFPSMENGVNCMHSKLMLLFHRRKETGEEWLRVVVPSANLTGYDWGERGTMENIVFLIDLPKLPTPEKSDLQFPTSLYSFCEAKEIPNDVLEKLSNYDYSATKGMAFVHSIGGVHYSEEVWKNTGYPGLGTAIKNLGYSSGKGLEVDFVTSSLGATHNDFVINMYNAAMGFDGSGDLTRRPPIGISHPHNHKNLNKKSLKQSKPKGKGKGKGEEETAKVEEPKVEAPSDTESDVGIECDEETSWERVQERFRLYFPSRDTVATSKGGFQSGGTICFQAHMWEMAGYPKEIVKDCVSVRKGVLMHNKMLFARPAKQLDTPVGKVDAWAYIGSANFSESAWGKLVMCRGKRKPKIKCKNWECGVVVPIIAESKSGQTLSGKAPEKPARTEPLGMEVFGDIIPVPMNTPAESIHPNKTPWFQAEIAMSKSQELKKRLKVMKKMEKMEKDSPRPPTPRRW